MTKKTKEILRDIGIALFMTLVIYTIICMYLSGKVV